MKKVAKKKKAMKLSTFLRVVNPEECGANRFYKFTLNRAYAHCPIAKAASKRGYRGEKTNTASEILKIFSKKFGIKESAAQAFTRIWDNTIGAIGKVRAFKAALNEAKRYERGIK